MRLLLNVILLLACAGLIADDTCDCHTGKSRDNFFPATRLIMTPVSVNNDTGLSFLGETGKRHYRLNGTWGGFCEECFRFKLGGEYLAQKFKYDFASGHERKWIHQLAFGGKAQAFHCHWKCIRGVQLSGFYSHSFSNTLHAEHCRPSSKVLKRHVAGAWMYDIEGGLMTTPYACSSLLFSAGFSEISYARRLKGRKRILGPTFSLDYNHVLTDRVGLNIKVQFTRAYNYLEGLISRCWPLHYGQLSFGAFGSHTWGKYQLPCSTLAGIEVRFNFGVDRCSIVTRNRCFSDDIDSCDCDLSGLGGWLADPAAYAPQVFAISENVKK